MELKKKNILGSRNVGRPRNTLPTDNLGALGFRMELEFKNVTFGGGAKEELVDKPSE